MFCFLRLTLSHGCQAVMIHVALAYQVLINMSTAACGAHRHYSDMCMPWSSDKTGSFLWLALRNSSSDRLMLTSFAAATSCWSFRWAHHIDTYWQEGYASDFLSITHVATHIHTHIPVKHYSNNNGNLSDYYIMHERGGMVACTPAF